MRKTTEIVLVLLGCGAGLFAAWYFLFDFFLPSEKSASLTVIEPTADPMPLPPEGQPNLQKRELEYHDAHLSTSVVHTLIVPAQAGFVVTPAIANTVATIDEFAQKTGAMAAINAGFFDPENQRTTSYVTVQGRLVADPTLNPRLTSNPALAAYLPKIFDRSEFRRYQCGQEVRYDIVLHSAPVPKECQLIDAIGGGPQLLPKNTAEAEGFVSYENGELIRDPLGSNQLNARSAIGITDKGDVVLMLVQQLRYSPDSGLSLERVTQSMKEFGVKKALNLDGGSSASFYYLGETIVGKRDQERNFVQRPVKSVLLVKKGM